MMIQDLGLPPHATAQKFIDAVAEMLKTTSYDKIKSNSVLARSGLTRGPMYHHFKDFDDLIESAQLQIYKEFASGVADTYLNLVTNYSDPGEVRERMNDPIYRQVPGNTSVIRWQCIGALDKAASLTRFRKKFMKLHEEITLKWIKIYEISAEGGWADPSISPRAFAYMMEASTLGRIYDDISPIKLADDDWVEIGIQLIENFLLKFVPRSESQE